MKLSICLSNYNQLRFYQKATFLEYIVFRMRYCRVITKKTSVVGSTDLRLSSHRKITAIVKWCVIN